MGGFYWFSTFCATVILATAMLAANRPYSMAVVPDSSRKNAIC